MEQAGVIAEKCYRLHLAIEEQRREFRSILGEGEWMIEHCVLRPFPRPWP